MNMSPVNPCGRILRCRAPLLMCMLMAVASAANAFTLWSTDYSFLGSGKFFGPGANVEDQALFAMVLNNLAFVSPVDFVTPFVNNGAAEPNTCAERQFSGAVDGKLSNGLQINENADLCPQTVLGTTFLAAVVSGGSHGGNLLAVTLTEGNVVMTADFVLDLNIGERGIIRIPFYGTTGSVTVPAAIQTQAGGKGVDQAGIYPSGTRIEGRIGDFNDDGWIDGTLVASLVMPLTSPVFPGQPFVVQRNFETNIPIDGVLAGNLRHMNGKQ